MTRKALAVALVCVLALSGVFAQGAAEQKQDVVTIRMEQFSGSEGASSGDALKEMISLFEKENPGIKVDLQTIGYDDYFTQLQSKVVGGNAADVFELNYENFVAYASQGALMDISDYLTDTSGYNQTALKAFNYQGVQYGVPNSFSNCVMFYNKDLFDKAGIDYPTSEWTWEDVEKASKKIMALGDNIWGFYRPLMFNEFYKGVEQCGGKLMSEDGKRFTVNSPEAIMAAEEMAGWQIDSGIMPTAADMGGMGDWDLFKSGRLGMLVTGIWAFGDFGANCDFGWDITVEPGNTAKAAHFFSNTYVVSSECEHPEEAAKLAQFLSGSKEATALRVEASWELPPVTYTDVLESYLNMTPPENREAVFESLNYSVTPPVVVQQAEMSSIIDSYLGMIVSGKMSAKDAMEACQKELEKKISL